MLAAGYARRTITATAAARRGLERRPEVSHRWSGIRSNPCSGRESGPKRRNRKRGEDEKAGHFRRMRGIDGDHPRSPRRGMDERSRNYRRARDRWPGLKSPFSLAAESRKLKAVFSQRGLTSRRRLIREKQMDLARDRRKRSRARSKLKPTDKSAFPTKSAKATFSDSRSSFYALSKRQASL